MLFLFYENTCRLALLYHLFIPDDYDKPIATSVNFINHLNYGQFEILGNKALKQNGKTRFKQILIKRK